jgi:hypothetical protein
MYLHVSGIPNNYQGSEVARLENMADASTTVLAIISELTMEARREMGIRKDPKQHPLRGPVLLLRSRV